MFARNKLFPAKQVSAEPNPASSIHPAGLLIERTCSCRREGGRLQSEERAKVEGEYREAGYAHVRRLMPPEITRTMLEQFWADLRESKLPIEFAPQQKLLTKPAMELHGSKYRPITTFLWGLTPTMSALAGRELLPTYGFFRLYQKGDVLRVHSDRKACEHSLSLTLGYADDRIWDFQVGHLDADQSGTYAEDFGDEPFTSIPMVPGDAVLYRGIDRRHGRMTPNPNKWSAHLFLHWVETDGPYRDQAFEGLLRREEPAFA